MMAKSPDCIFMKGWLNPKAKSLKGESAENATEK